MGNNKQKQQRSGEAKLMVRCGVPTPGSIGETTVLMHARSWMVSAQSLQEPFPGV